jgi:hypothetical protein
VNLPRGELGMLSGLDSEKGAVLARMFRHTRMSYKFFWFLGLLELIAEGKGPTIPVIHVLYEMAVRAWHPVCFYRLSLGVGDVLQEKVRGFLSAASLESKSSRSEILAFLSDTQWATEQLQHCVAYVPTRLLQAHFQTQLEGLPDQRKDALTKQLAAESQNTNSPSMYWLRSTPSGDILEINEEWRRFIVTHCSILQSFAEYQLCRYLQAKNPNVPGIVNKLQAPLVRRMESTRKYWADARAAFARSGRSDWFVDIYTLQPLADSFAIDHFLPWSFVAHDLPWNLTPVSRTTNSAKGDRLPHLDRYLPHLATLHHRALRMLCLYSKRTADERTTPYAECFNMEASSILKLSEAEFVSKYWQVIEPQERIARCQGFSVYGC